MKRTAKRIKFCLTVLLALAAFGAAAQQGSPLRFAHEEWDFGTIREADGRVTHVFTFTNAGKTPMVIDEVTVSCGCTSPRFSREPVLPGRSASVSVTFDPTNRPGRFNKEVTVLSSNRRHRNVLTLKGQVVGREKSVEERYPFEAGGGLRFDSRLAAFTYVAQGEAKSVVLNYVNTSPRPLELRLQRNEPASGFLRIDAPQRIAAGEQGTITLTYLVPKASERFGWITDTFTLGAEGGGKPLTVKTTGIVTEDFGPIDPSHQPKASFDRLLLRFEQAARAQKPVTLRFTLSNEGTGDLIVRAVQPPARGIACSLRPGTRIAPGKELSAEVTIDPSCFEAGRVIERITLVMNDRSRPMREIRITGIITE